MLSILSYVTGTSVCPPWRSVHWGPLPFFKIGLSSWCGGLWVLYIFWRSNPCLRYHWQMYFPIWLVPFSFCWFSLAMQKIFFMRSHLFILSFMSLALEDISVKILLLQHSLKKKTEEWHLGCQWGAHGWPVGGKFWQNYWGWSPAAAIRAGKALVLLQGSSFCVWWKKNVIFTWFPTLLHQGMLKNIAPFLRCRNISSGPHLDARIA